MMLNSTTSATSDTIHGNSVYESADSSQSFDDIDVLPEENESSFSGKEGDNSDWSQPDEETSKEIKKKLETTKKTKEDVGEELKLLSDSDGNEDEKPAKKEKVEEEDEESEDEETVEASEETKDLPKESKGKFKVRVDGELFNLDGEATFRHKIDGEWQDIPVAEALSSYSSKVVREKAFQEVQTQQKELVAQRGKVESAKQKMRDLIDPVFNILQDETKDPFEALQFLVDKIGGDPQRLYKRSLETRMEELDKLLNMSETERNLYFVSKENEFLKNRVTQRQQADLEVQEANSFRQEVDKLRQEHGVSESDFVEAVDELEKLYGDEFSNWDKPSIVKYAAQRPHIKAVQELAQPYVEEIGESNYSKLVWELSNGLWQKHFTPEQVKSHLHAKFGVTSGLKELNKKMAKANSGSRPEAKGTKDDDKIQSFDDLID